MPDITFETAISLLSKTRFLMSQHARILNIFFKKKSDFREKPITGKNIVSLYKTFPDCRMPISK